MQEKRSTESSQVEQRIQAALALFLEAWDYANDAGRDPWDFAIEIEDLLKPDGVSKSGLLWLIYKGYVEHQHETDSTDYLRREFDASPNGLTFVRESCFALTQAGELFARKIVANVQPSLAPPRVVHADSSGNGQRPIWDGDIHELKIASKTVKRFRLPSPNQEAVLSAFQEEQWPKKIDDPLTPKTGIDPKRRLHDTIRNLNRNQLRKLLRFSGDGTGEGVIWQLCSESPEWIQSSTP